MRAPSATAASGEANLEGRETKRATARLEKRGRPASVVIIARNLSVSRRTVLPALGNASRRGSERSGWRKKTGNLSMPA